MHRERKKFLILQVFVASGTDIQCIGHFRLLFSLLRLESCPKMQEMALTVLANVTGSSECIDDIAANQVSPIYALQRGFKKWRETYFDFKLLFKMIHSFNDKRLTFSALYPIVDQT
jgi:hypothetical protein